MNSIAAPAGPIFFELVMVDVPDQRESYVINASAIRAVDVSVYSPSGVHKLPTKLCAVAIAFDGFDERWMIARDASNVLRLVVPCSVPAEFVEAALCQTLQRAAAGLATAKKSVMQLATELYTNEQERQAASG